jgi:signal transduction histidine kinase
MGLESMQERIEALGGKFGVDSSPGAGTRIEIELP